MKKNKKKIIYITSSIALLLILILSLPIFLKFFIENNKVPPVNTFHEFPVTVNPKNKTIIEDEQVNLFLADKHSLLGATIMESKYSLWNIFENIALTIANTPWYENTASFDNRFITIKPGMRKEQVANIFGDILKWNIKQRKEFVTPVGSSTLPLTEGSFTPGLYSVSLGMTPSEVQSIVNERFSDVILSHYSTSTREIVPVKDALIIASLIQRETLSTDGMRLLSGIMWNRLFLGMKLQIDSTLQYAKANKSTEKSWWPKVVPNDKYIASPFNTYKYNGLPPSPIANPSVEAILAALNPIETSCLFYFNDKTGAFHCSDNYIDHVSQIKKYYNNL
ncbi:MAG: endolytic transglycosylase MltG [Candidatus Paceibacterota bacterium]|jgi:UPF0755 protein